jgi:hypothetical protein
MRKIALRNGDLLHYGTALSGVSRGSRAPAAYNRCVSADKRTHRRLAAQWTVRLGVDGRTARGATENVSPAGAMLHVDMDPMPAAGQGVDLAFELPNGDAFDAQARIMWVSEILPGVLGVQIDDAPGSRFAAAVEALEARRAGDRPDPAGPGRSS